MGRYGENGNLSKAQIRILHAFPEAATYMLVSNSQRRKEIPENKISEEIFDLFHVKVPIGSDMYNP